MSAPVEPVKGISSNFNPEFMSNSGNMEQTIGGARDGGMNKNGVFKAVHGHDVGGLHIVHLGQLYRQLTRPASVLNQVRAGSGEQGTAG